MIIRGYELGAKAIAVIAVALLLVAFLLFGPAACRKYQSMRAQNRLNTEQTGALANSAADAVKTQGEANKRETDSEATTRENEKEIRNAEGASDAVNPAVRDAGIRSLCKRPAYRDSERCKLFNAPSR